MIIKLIVPGKIQSKQRPRFSKKGHTYTPQATVSYETLIKFMFLQNYKEFIPLKTPLILTIRAFFLKAKSNKMSYATIKPDLDNVIKCIDALNKLAFEDDKQIIKIIAEKKFGDNERLEIEIEEII